MERGHVVTCLSHVYLSLRRIMIGINGDLLAEFWETIIGGFSFFGQTDFLVLLPGTSTFT